MKCQRIPLCKSTLHRSRASRPLASRIEEEAVRDDARVVRTSVLHQVYSPAALGEAKTAGDCCRCTRTPAQASPTPAPSRASSPSPPQGMQAKLTTPSSSDASSSETSSSSDPDASSSETSSSDASSSAASSRLVGSQPSLTRGRRLGHSAARRSLSSSARRDLCSPEPCHRERS